MLMDKVVVLHELNGGAHRSCHSNLSCGWLCLQAGPVFISTDRYDNPLERTNIDPPCLTLDRREIITSTASFAMKKELKQDPV